MSAYSEFFLNSKSSIVQLETFEISHSAFTRTYYIVRNMVSGVTVTLEDLTTQFFQYYPAAIVPVGSNDDLEQSLKISLGDLGEVLPTELDAVQAADAFREKPAVKYRTYRSDELTSILYGPLILEVKNFAFNKEGATFEAKAPSLNIHRTGEIYQFDRFPMLRGFL